MNRTFSGDGLWNQSRMIARLCVLGAAMVSAAGAYYHFVRYLTRNAPFQPVFEKYDLAAMPGRAVQVLVSDRGPAQYAPNDSYAAVLSQIRLAAKTWDEVATSDLRVAFGGSFTPDSPTGNGTIEVLFDEVPPGLIALGGPTSRDTIRTGPNESFIPILRSTVVLRRDLSQRPSYSESFFLSVTHEIGHALGLQHTLTSSVMSTEVTRATTKARPLSADDVAGISLLYPTASFLATTGSISGRVVSGGEGISLASVVAISPDGPTVSALTNPDGSYRIDGIPPGSYFLYAHPLPPAQFGEVTPANIVLPADVDGLRLSPGPSFETVFFPGVRDTNQASAVLVSAGKTVEGVDFSVLPRSAPGVYGVQTYSFPGQVAVKPAHLSPSGNRNFVVASGFGLVTGLAPSAGLSVSVLGGSAALAPDGLRPYGPDPRFVQMDFQLNPFSGEGARHLLFNLGSELYVLPSGVRFVNSVPPRINSLQAGVEGNPRLLAISGTGLSAATRILFDGIAGRVVRVDDSGILIVQAPVADAQHRASVVALNPDGQSSLFLQGGSPPTFDFLNVDAPPASVVVTPSQLVAGTEQMIEINSPGAGFAQPDVSVGAGTGDIRIRRIWVVNPNRILANIVVSPSAGTGIINLTVVNGLRATSVPSAMLIQPQAGRVLSLVGPVADARNGRVDVPAGAPARVGISGLPAELPLGSFQVNINDRPAVVQSFTGGQLVFVVPAGLSPGPAVLRVSVGGEILPPLLMSVDLPPPVINLVSGAAGVVDAARPARGGDTLVVTATALFENPADASASSIAVTVGGVGHKVAQLLPIRTQPGAYQIVFTLDPLVPAGTQPLIISIDGRPSAPVSVPVRGN